MTAVKLQRACLCRHRRGAWRERRPRIARHELGHGMRESLTYRGPGWNRVTPNHLAISHMPSVPTPRGKPVQD